MTPGEREDTYMDLGWLELYFDGLVGDDTGYSEVEWAIKEIKALRKMIEDYEYFEDCEHEGRGK
jgi:hypothetical protein